MVGHLGTPEIGAGISSRAASYYYHGLLVLLGHKMMTVFAGHILKSYDAETS
jgi:hypothetical protein